MWKRWIAKLAKEFVETQAAVFIASPPKRMRIVQAWIEQGYIEGGPTMDDLSPADQKKYDGMATAALMEFVKAVL